VSGVMTRTIKTSSGNVFADLGVANPEEHTFKAELVRKLAEVMKMRGLNQTETAKLTGISQPDLSKILRGRFRDVSAARLMRALTMLD
jgi:predicted XRE-type DNA-binding protein